MIILRNVVSAIRGDLDIRITLEDSASDSSMSGNMVKKRNRGDSHKRVRSTIWSNSDWKVVEGWLVPAPGRPKKISHLFRHVAEKLPFESLSKVKKWMEENGQSLEGVYMAHDSMGVARYGGRGKIFDRLISHRRKYPKELVYFSFYVIANKAHEREIETAILRAASSQMILNQRKIRTGIDPGNINDYEPGTEFFQRQLPKGRKASGRSNKS
jgi:hypothetical protein